MEGYSCQDTRRIVSFVGLTLGIGGAGACITSRIFFGGLSYPDAPAFAAAGAEPLFDEAEVDCADAGKVADAAQVISTPAKTQFTAFQTDINSLRCSSPAKAARQKLTAKKCMWVFGSCSSRHPAEKKRQSANMLGCHLGQVNEASYDPFDEDGDNIDSGVNEEFWAGPKKYRRICKTDNLNQTGYATRLAHLRCLQKINCGDFTARWRIDARPVADSCLAALPMRARHRVRIGILPADTVLNFRRVIGSQMQRVAQYREADFSRRRCAAIHLANQAFLRGSAWSGSRTVRRLIARRSRFGRIGGLRRNLCCVHRLRRRTRVLLVRNVLHVPLKAFCERLRLRFILRRTRHLIHSRADDLRIVIPI